MNSENIKQNIAKLPDNPGVYFFRGKNKKILYIGKATSLRDRVRSYFSGNILETRGPLISKMLNQFEVIDHIKTDSVLEALILEAELIKKYQPEANIQEKDNKSFNFVIITKEDFPRVLLVRGRELLNSNYLREKEYKIAYSFGPFPNGGQLKEALKIIRKMFPYRDNSCKPLSRKPCFNRQIGLCPGVCTGEISKEDYKEQIKNIVLFFQGNKKRLLNNLEKQMKSFAKDKRFEEANHTKRTLFALNHIQDVSLIRQEKVFKEKSTIEFRIESYDIAHMSGQNVVGVMTVVEDGEVKKSDYRKFKIKEESGLPAGRQGVNDTKALSEIMSRRLGHNEWRLPNLIVVDGGVAQKRAIERVLSKNFNQIPVVSVVKDEHHRPKEILGDKKWLQYEREILLSNSEAHRFGISYHKKLRGKLV